MHTKCSVHGVAFLICVLFVYMAHITREQKKEEKKWKKKTRKLPPETYNLNLLRSTSVICRTKKYIPAVLKFHSQWSEKKRTQRREQKSNPRWDVRARKKTNRKTILHCIICTAFRFFSTSNFKIRYAYVVRVYTTAAR